MRDDSCRRLEKNTVKSRTNRADSIDLYCGECLKESTIIANISLLIYCPHCGNGIIIGA